MKITIRFSIASLFVALLLFISLSIIFLNYNTMGRILYGSAQELLNKSGGLIRGDNNM